MSIRKSGRTMSGRSIMPISRRTQPAAGRTVATVPVRGRHVVFATKAGGMLDFSVRAVNAVRLPAGTGPDLGPESSS